MGFFWPRGLGRLVNELFTLERKQKEKKRKKSAVIFLFLNVGLVDLFVLRAKDHRAPLSRTWLDLSCVLVFFARQTSWRSISWSLTALVFLLCVNETEDRPRISQSHDPIIDTDVDKNIEKIDARIGNVLNCPCVLMQFLFPTPPLTCNGNTDRRTLTKVA